MTHVLIVDYCYGVHITGCYLHCATNICYQPSEFGSNKLNILSLCVVSRPNPLPTGSGTALSIYQPACRPTGHLQS